MSLRKFLYYSRNPLVIYSTLLATCLIISVGINTIKGIVRWNFWISRISSLGINNNLYCFCSKTNVANNRRMRMFFHYLLSLYNIFPPVGKYLSWRGNMVSKYIYACGKNLKVASRVNIYDPSMLSCGDNVYIGYNTYIGGGKVKLDDEVIIGPFCCIVAGNHTAKDGSYRFGKYQFGSIEIGKGTWLGAHATITADVKIGKGCVIAANAVVTKDVPDFTMVGGVPAKYIKSTLR